MKKVFLSLAFAALVAGGAVAQEQPKAKATAPQEQAVNGPAITFDETEHNFGDITQGDVVEHTFKFTNTGTQPLVIERVDVSCGCTTPAWTKEPVMPGKTGFISAKFNSAGKMGQQKKPLTIHSNAAGGTKYVYFVTNIKPKAEAASAKN
ncbi:uncharacterized protein DUF1573 [Pontibacter ummariensis]|uniref:DUF1573 domain-containing protein n=1 Tax=Pontibacter ummariensis TaxID=1610492 RepID=A0A239C4P5_9BACT|nr:DUF1573 domain-containing protein [Pontibacter ummariensis]PRY15446.1 uncharacterized protein DUF1573 [Pontibacter ummariensis]SNS15156.1 Protein of unknown function [Pontibacter ummariensis]